MPPLVSLLHDDEDRTRANAAGALGNLVRNSGMLCRDIMQAGALEVRAMVARACALPAGPALHRGIWRPDMQLCDRSFLDFIKGFPAFSLSGLSSPRLVALPQAMLELIQRRDLPPTPGGSAPGDSTSSVQIALFSLGNLCAHAECAEALSRLGLGQALDAVLSERGGDATVQRYVARIRQKTKL